MDGYSHHGEWKQLISGSANAFAQKRVDDSEFRLTVQPLGKKAQGTAVGALSDESVSECYLLLKLSISCNRFDMQKCTVSCISKTSIRSKRVHLQVIIMTELPSMRSRTTASTSRHTCAPFLLPL